MVELSNKVFVSDIIRENSPSNPRNKGFSGIYPFKLWTIAAVLKYKFNIHEINRADLFTMAAAWVPKYKQVKELDCGCL